MSIRRDPIYVSTEVWRWLRLLAKADNAKGKNQEVNDMGIITADGIADQILRQAIREQHPALVEHTNQIEKLEKEIIKTL